MQYYARPENAKGEKELLTTHLQKTATLAQRFAEAFGEGNAGAWLGWFHDVGKASDKFQGVLAKREQHVNHAAAGALMLNKFPQLSRVIYAHHDGLCWDIEDDLKCAQNEEGSNDTQEGKQFAVSGKAQCNALSQWIRAELSLPKPLEKLHPDGTSFYQHLPEMLHTRMLLSCLCDADYTASASHEDESIMRLAEEIPLQAAEILERLLAYREKIRAQSTANPALNRMRDDVFTQCMEAGKHAPGLFTLTAPTGTGKTLALLGFAVQHAKEYGKRRVIVVLPFLSIISQNVKIYRDICGNVLEAHSMASYGDDEHLRVLAERWNAPVIVTTAVHFFEAFFRSKPSDLRFLHSIANSVVVFDEAQSIPHNLVGTSMETLRLLCESFSCTVLLSTATQPVYDARKDISFPAYDILKDPVTLYQQANRVSVEWCVETPVALEQIAEEMATRNSVCCVLNRKDHTRQLFESLLSRCPPETCFYVTTDLCKEHRDAVLAEISSRQKNNLPCRLVATSCIEAGVDLDFAYMYRALAPLEAIIQCAGRCNRNGQSAGEMTVFLPDAPKLYPTVTYQNATEKVKLLLSRHPIDLCNPAHIRAYYTELYTDANYDHDKPELQAAIAAHDFAEVAKQYRMIPQSGVNVLVPYAVKQECFDALAEEARTVGISKGWMHRAAPITVSCYQEQKLRELAEPCVIRHKGRAMEVPGWYILLAPDCYDARMGLHLTAESSLDYLI